MRKFVVGLVLAVCSMAFALQKAVVTAVYMNGGASTLAVGQTTVVTASGVAADGHLLPPDSAKVTFSKASARGCVKVTALGNNQALVTGIASDPKFGSTALIEAHVGNVLGFYLITCLR